MENQVVQLHFNVDKLFINNLAQVEVGKFSSKKIRSETFISSDTESEHSNLDFGTLDEMYENEILDNTDGQDVENILDGSGGEDIESP